VTFERQREGVSGAFPPRSDAGIRANDRDPPRELRHSFVSLLSDAKVPIEVISRLVGHSGTAVTERVYRHQIRPVVEEAATEMDRIFPDTAAQLLM
jgi:integrase